MLALVKRLRGGPWLWAATQIVKLARKHWAGLPEKDRTELRRIVRKSRGKRGNLTQREQERAKTIVRAFIRNADNA